MTIDDKEVKMENASVALMTVAQIPRRAQRPDEKGSRGRPIWAMIEDCSH